MAISKVRNERFRTSERRKPKTGTYIGLLADLPGPKLRLGRFEGEVELLRGELVDLPLWLC